MKTLWFVPIILIGSSVYSQMTLSGNMSLSGSLQVDNSSSPAAVGGSGSLTFAWQSGKIFSGGATSLTSSDFAVAPTTKGLIAVGVVGGSTHTTCTDNRGNTYVQDNFDGRIGAAAAVYHFVATATYFGAYNITCGVTPTSSILMGIVVTSNTGSSAGLDVTTTAYNTATANLRIYTGTSTTTNENTGLLFSAAVVGSGTNDSMGPLGKLTQVAEEENGTAFQEGLIAYSTTNVAGVVTHEEWSNSATGDSYGTATALFKSIP